MFLAKFRLINNKMSCDSCEIQMHLVKDKKIKDGFRWMCYVCNKKFSIRNKSFFFNSRLNFKLLIKLIYKLSGNIEMLIIAHDLKLNRRTVSFWSELIRDSIVYFMGRNKTKIGGLDNNSEKKVVEVDESLFLKLKYNRGVRREGCWYIGGIERVTSNCFIVPVENRNSTTIKRIVKENIYPNTKIITDEWRAYGAALGNDSNYEHRTINHSYHFVDPNDPSINTQKIEGFWSQCKRALRAKNGINKESEFNHLIKFTWEMNVEKAKRFNQIIILFMASDYDECFN